jgi:hypothetical protein
MTETEMMEAISVLRAEFADVAEVEEQQLTDRLRAISFRPTNPDAARAVLIVGISDVVVEIGRAGRFELDLDEEPLEIVRATAVGRVTEKTTVLGTTCRVLLVDGTEKKSTRLFNWTVLGGSTRQYAAWRSPGK